MFLNFLWMGISDFSVFIQFIFFLHFAQFGQKSQNFCLYSCLLSDCIAERNTIKLQQGFLCASVSKARSSTNFFVVG